MNLGLPLGVLVGFVSGTAFILLVSAARRGELLKVAGSLVGLPAIWFGGGWLTTVFDVDEILSWYVSSLCVTTVAIGMVSLFGLIRDAARAGGTV